LKEWSYLSTSRFKPNPKVLEKYNLVPYEYVFVREVSNKSFNYFDQSDGIVCSFSHELTFTKFVLSLEDKSIASKFPKHWTLLEEPVEDIHSLIYFSKLVISSGDSMAREGAMLGIPSVYCGIREMKANHILEDKGMLKHLPGASGINFINEHTSKAFEKSRQSELRKHLEETWDDMVQFMKNQINHYKRKE
jgi:predicted glycosyltransferase